MTLRRIGDVTPGHYRYRRVRGGPWLPALVTVEDGMIYVVDRGDRLSAGIAVDAHEDLIVNAVMAGEAFTDRLVRIMWFGEPIDQTEYEHLLAVLAWARENHPEHPMLRPDEPIRLNEVRVSSIF